MSNKKMKVYLCSFADTRLGISACRFKQEAGELDFFEDIFIYNESNLEPSFKAYFKDKFYMQKISQGGGA